MRQIILIFIFSAISFASFGSQKIYVVSVGVADYPGTKNDLSLTVNDAKVIKWLYDTNKKAETVLLTNSSATRNNVLYQMNKLFSKASKGDMIVLFFSGHGYQGGFYDSSNGKISYSDIKKIMAKSPAKNKMIFADACYSGDFREAKQSGANPLTAKDINVLLFLSSRSNETSIERRSMDNGFFTTYLQKALRGNADANRDRTVTAKELYNYVSKGVVDISSGRQHPVMWGNFKDSMPVIEW